MRGDARTLPSLPITLIAAIAESSRVLIAEIPTYR
jgi:hypothetical protein